MQSKNNNRKRQIIVRNLPSNIKWQTLKDFFNQEEYKVERADVTKKGNNVIGTIVYATEEGASEAVTTYDNFKYEGKELKVCLADDYNEEEPEAPVTSTSLYVGNLPYNLGWQDLKDLFRGTTGEVIRADVFKDYQGRSKGYGIVQMKTVEDAKIAIDDLNGFEIEGRKLEVREDRNNEKEGCQLHVGNLPFEERWQSLKEHFSEAGNVLRADVIIDNGGRSKGFGTVIMSTPEEAQKAIEMFNDTDFNGRNIQVKLDKFAGEYNNRGNYNNGGFYRGGRGGRGGRGRGSFRGGRGGFRNSRSPQKERGIEVTIGNIPFSTRWRELKELIVGLDLTPTFVDVPIEGSRPRGYGIAEFSTEDEANDAIEKLTDYEYQGRKLFAKLNN